jgi:hypothetical protein
MQPPVLGASATRAPRLILPGEGGDDVVRPAKLGQRELMLVPAVFLVRRKMNLCSCERIIVAASSKRWSQAYSTQPA